MSQVQTKRHIGAQAVWVKRVGHANRGLWKKEHLKHTARHKNDVRHLPKGAKKSLPTWRLINELF
jgi:hypothetical protein